MSDSDRLPDGNTGQESSGSLSRRKFVLGAAGAMGALALGPAGSAFAPAGAPATRSRSRSLSPTRRSSGYPLLLQGCHAARHKARIQILESHANHQLYGAGGRVNTWIGQRSAGSSCFRSTTTRCCR